MATYTFKLYKVVYVNSNGLMLFHVLYCLFSAKMRRIMMFFSAKVCIVGGFVVILQPKY